MIAMRVEGLDVLARNLNELPSRVSKSVLREALRTVAAPPIRARASALAPRAPGAPDLADHIVISTGRAGGERSASVVVGPSTASRSDQSSIQYDRQGRYVEFGTSDTRMQPFMRPAFDEEAARTLQPLIGALWRALIGRGFSTRGGSSGGGLL